MDNLESKNDDNIEFLRLEEIANLHFGSISKMSEMLGKSRQFLGTYKKKRSFGRKVLRDIELAFGINPKYLETGEGEMLVIKPSENILEENKPAIKINNAKGVPFYSIDVTASILESFNDIQEQPEYYVDFSPLNDCSAYLPVFGDSMYPKYASGEIVAVKQITNYDVLLWGEAYLIITDSEANNLRTIKLLFHHQDPDKVILKASNPNFNGDTVICKKNIVNLFIIKGKITRNQL